jgi:beta-N-acetylhexosaminidase
MSEFEDILTPDVRFHLVRRMERHKVIALAGPSLLPHEQKYLEFHNVAGVILFQRNVHSLSQVGELIQSVVETLDDDAPPPLIMADHEGDLVSELRDIIGAPPSALAIAAAGDTDLAADVARETGMAMRKLGLNAVLAPAPPLLSPRRSTGSAPPAWRPA